MVTSLIWKSHILKANAVYSSSASIIQAWRRWVRFAKISSTKSLCEAKSDTEKANQEVIFSLRDMCVPHNHLILMKIRLSSMEAISLAKSQCEAKISEMHASAAQAAALARANAEVTSKSSRIRSVRKFTSTRSKALAARHAYELREVAREKVSAYMESTPLTLSCSISNILTASLNFIVLSLSCRL
jgi:hypothetical protein